jgi:hypothetical protein
MVAFFFQFDIHVLVFIIEYNLLFILSIISFLCEIYFCVSLCTEKSTELIKQRKNHILHLER